MGFACTRSVAVVGVEGVVVDVEVYTANGLPRTMLSGLPDSAVTQARYRLKAGFAAQDISYHSGAISMNFAPASLNKSGAGFDLAMAVGLMASTNIISATKVRGVVHMGEVGMDGSVRAVRGVLPAVFAAAAAGIHTVMVPADNAQEAKLVPNMQVLAVDNLRTVQAVYQAWEAGKELPFTQLSEVPNEESTSLPDFSQVLGQAEAVWAAEVAAAGGHHMWMIGPPGSGKTLIAERLPGIMPPLTQQESLEVTAIHSVMGILAADSCVRRPPFVSPHHGTSVAGLIGGGSGPIRPGAVCQAHRGVLFLDEAPEFRRDALEALRQPLESGKVTIVRAQNSVVFPARFQTVLASNPCPCGKHGGLSAECQCSPLEKRRYDARISGPVRDRIDMQLRLPALTRDDLTNDSGESSAAIAERVQLARHKAQVRWADNGCKSNAEIPGSLLRSSKFRLPGKVVKPLDEQLDLGIISMRGYDRCLRLAWTLADLDDQPQPTTSHVNVALTLRVNAQN